jgi:hypothetical protein
VELKKSVHGGAVDESLPLQHEGADEPEGRTSCGLPEQLTAKRAHASIIYSE